MLPWEAIKAEYLAGGITQRALADKYRVSASAIGRRASREGWMKQREQIAYKSSAEAAEIMTKEKASVLAKLMKINDLTQEMLKAQLERHDQDNPLTPAELSQIGQALRALVAVTRDLYSLPTETEKIGWERLNIERERLKLEQHKAEHDAGNGNTYRWVICMEQDQKSNEPGD